MNLTQLEVKKNNQAIERVTNVKIKNYNLSRREFGQHILLDFSIVFAFVKFCISSGIHCKGEVLALAILWRV